MIGLTLRLAVNNLQKNRKLYYAYALVTSLVTAIFYIFTSLTFHADLSRVHHSSGVSQVLGLGMVVVMIATAVLIFYANSFVMKNRSKELGLYSLLGLEKKHLLLMTLWENTLFSLATVSGGLLLGLTLDKLFYAILLKMMQMEVVLQSTFQINNFLLVFFTVLGLFLLVSLFNAGKLAVTDSMKLVKGKRRGEVKGGFLWLQTLVGLVVLGGAYALAQFVESPIKALPTFFMAVLLVILATYLLFRAGSIVGLTWLKGRENYYYKPANFISLSNLVFRMKKNAMGLATISLLSTMFLVTIVGGVNLYLGGSSYILKQNPNDFSIDSGLAFGKEKELAQMVRDTMAETSIPIEKEVIYPYGVAYLSDTSQEGVHLLSSEERSTVGFSDRFGVALILDQATFESMTGNYLDLGGDELVLYSKQALYGQGQSFAIGERDYKVEQILPSNPILGHLPETGSFLLPHFMVWVVKDLSAFGDMTDYRLYTGFESSLTEAEQVAVKEQILQAIFESQLWEENLNEVNQSTISLAYRAYALEGYFKFTGSLLFISLLLSLIFLLAVVLVIYFKQISEGYEDRERFQVMQKVGLDYQQTKASIRKQLVTVFFAPVCFAFLHLAFAYKMLVMILNLLGVVEPQVILLVTLGTCALYFLVYLAVYGLTSRSYYRIVTQ